MMWTCPSNDNDFTVLGKCKVGHRSDILCVESSSQFIVSAGIDGLLSIWNLFSGTLKFAVELPPPKLINEPEIRDFNYLSNGAVNRERSLSMSSEDISEKEDDTNFGNIESKSKDYHRVSDWAIVKSGFNQRRSNSIKK